MKWSIEDFRSKGLVYLQKRAKVEGDARFVETYRKGVSDDKLKETLMLRRPPITTRMELREVITVAQIVMLEHTKEFITPVHIKLPRSHSNQINQSFLNLPTREAVIGRIMRPWSPEITTLIRQILPDSPGPSGPYSLPGLKGPELPGEVEKE